MLVVADSSPLNILVRLGCVGVLPALFESVSIPPQVRDELTNDRTPLEVREFFLSPPAWLEIRAARSVEVIPSIDAGEEAAIALTRELGAVALLIDDPAGRRAAQERGVSVIGTLGVLERSAERDLISLPAIVPALLRTDFRLSAKLVADALRRDEARRHNNS